jgi:ParB/RepB/Spo0J family partition protein
VETCGTNGGNPSEPWEVSADLLIPFETEETKPMKIIETKEILIQDLKHHPKNHDIYGKWEDVSDLEQSLTGYGQTRPIIVNKNLEILSGNRRLIAAKNIGMLTLACEIREFDNEVFELEFLLIENIQRAKNTEQKVREGQIWKEIETSRAKERQRRNKNETQITQGAVRDILAEKVGLGSGYNFQKAEKIVIEIDKLLNNGEAKKAEDLREALNKSVNRGTELLKEWEQKSTSVDLIDDDSEIVDDTVKEEDFFEKIKSQQKAEMNTISAMAPSKDTLKQYRFISKSSVWGYNGAEKVELKPDTIVEICNDESVSQALVYPIEMKDARFFIDRVNLCLISDLEIIEGIWRDRMSLSLASNPTPRTEAQFYCCTSLTDNQNLDFSKRRL